MKKYSMQGFSTYEIRNDRTVTQNGQPVKQTAAQKTKGQVVLTADEEVDLGEGKKITKGQKVPFDLDVLMDVPEDQWEEVAAITNSTTPASTEAPKELTADEKAKAEKTAKRKELKASVKACEDYLTSDAPATPEDYIAGKEKLKVARQALADFETANGSGEFTPTAEQKVIIDEYLALVENRNAFKQLTEDLTGAIKNFQLPAGYKAPSAKGGTAGDSVPQRAPKLNYDIAQELRKDVAAGMEIKDVCAKYNVTAYAVKCIANYTNYKLKEGDTAYTPLPESVKKVDVPATTSPAAEPEAAAEATV